MGRQIFALMLLLTAGVTGADETNDSDLSPWAIDTITPIHDSVTRWVDNTARNIDGFFGTIDSDSVDNESYLRLSTDFDWAESEEFDIDPGIRFKLDVPTTEERLRLIIESDPEESRGTLEEQGAERLRNDTDGLGDTVAGLTIRTCATALSGSGNWATARGNYPATIAPPGSSMTATLLARAGTLADHWTAHATCALSASCNGRRITTNLNSRRVRNSTRYWANAVPFATRRS